MIKYDDMEIDDMPNRYICDVFTEMRKAHKTHNYSYLPGLIEEAQSLANRMESALYNKKDIERYAKELSRIKKEYKDAKKQLEILKEEIDGKSAELRGKDADNLPEFTD